MPRRVQVLLAVLLVCARGATAGPRQFGMADFVQDLWDAGENSLPHPTVTGILQTRDGYLWVSTFTGVVRFDGVDFKHPEIVDPRSREALSHNVRCLFEAKDGAMWFGTRRDGAVRLDRGRAQLFSTDEGLPSGDVRAIAQTPDGTTWLATARGLTARDASGRFRTYLEADGLPSRSVLTLFVDRDGSLWAGTVEFGVVRFDGTKLQPIALGIPESMKVIEYAPGLPARSVGALTRDADGVLWAGTSIGLVRVPEAGAGVATIFPGAVNGLWASPRRGLWASTGAGLGRLQGGQWRQYTSREGLITDGLTTVFEDFEGSIWVGTRVGLARLRPRAIQTYTQRDGLGHDYVASVFEARNGDVWVGHRNGASRLRQGAWTTIGTAEGLPNASVRSIGEGADGAIWIGTLHGLSVYKEGRLKTYRDASEQYTIRGMAFDDKGPVWVSTEGLDRLVGDKVTRVLSRDDLCARGSANWLHRAGDGTLWLATGTGLARIRDGKAECLLDKDVLRNDIRALYEDTDGVLWVGSVGGLSRIDGGPSGTLAAVNLPFKAAIYAMLEDGQGALWFSTPMGLYRVVKKDLSRRLFDAALYRAFGAADGMDTPVGASGGQPSAWRGRDGRLWFSTATGVAVVDPSRIELDGPMPPVHIAELVADRVPVDIGGARRLAAGTRDVELHYALLSFVAPERAQYRYMLEGYDESWVESGARRVAYYSNLPPRRYRFRVLAANHNGIWNETGAALEFELLPHVYQRVWFVPLCVLLALAGGVALHRYRTAQLRVREAQLQVRVDEAVSHIKMLRGMLPICASCKKIRDDSGYWTQMESYIAKHSEADFSHGICPDCILKLYPEYAVAAFREPPKE